MKQFSKISVLFAFSVLFIVSNAFSESLIEIHITGNCKKIGVSNVVEGDVFLNGNLYKSRVTGIGIKVPAGKHQIKVNGYCYDMQKRVKRDLGVWSKTVKIKDGKAKKYKAKF